MEAKGADVGSRMTPLQHPWPPLSFPLGDAPQSVATRRFQSSTRPLCASLWPDLRSGHRVLKNRRISRTTIACCLGSLMNVPCDV
jgi:hypothetical protein